MLLSPLPLISNWLIYVSVLFILFRSLFLMHIFHVGAFFGHSGGIVLTESFDVTLAFAGYASSYSRRLEA